MNETITLEKLESLVNGHTLVSVSLHTDGITAEVFEPGLCIITKDDVSVFATEEGGDHITISKSKIKEVWLDFEPAGEELYGIIEF